MHENRRHDGCIDISEHAKLRAMQRLGVVESVTNHLYELLDRATPVETDHVSGGQAWRIGNIYLVTDSDGETLQTVFEKEADR